LDDLLPDDHPARVVWAAVGRLDLSAFADPIRSRGDAPGRAATDPRLLVSVWLYAYTEGVSSGRQAADLCDADTGHAAYQWLCGGVTVNYHTLNDFRVNHRDALDELFTQVLGRLTHARLVRVERITQDGTKVRANAGSGSFGARGTLERHLADARDHVAALGRLGDEAPAAASARQRANQDRAAADRLGRLTRAMDELAKVEAAKAGQKDKPSKHKPAKASATDPEARMQKMPDGGYRPAYNVQFAQDPASRAIVGVAVAPDSSDKNQAEAMRRQVEERTGGKVVEHVVDGNYVALGEIDRAAEQGVTVYAPVPKAKAAGQDRFAPRKTDTPAVAEWRARMNTPEGREAYRDRARTCETVNADLKTHRGLGPTLPGRGAGKVLCAALWSALAYNLLHFGAALLALA